MAYLLSVLFLFYISLFSFSVDIFYLFISFWFSFLYTVILFLWCIDICCETHYPCTSTPWALLKMYDIYWHMWHEHFFWKIWMFLLEYVSVYFDNTSAVCNTQIDTITKMIYELRRIEMRSSKKKESKCVYFTLESKCKFHCLR